MLLNNMKCPYCLENFHVSWYNFPGDISDLEGHYQVRRTHCPSCKRVIIELGTYIQPGIDGGGDWTYQLVKPKGISRSPVSNAVPDTFVNDYKEACLVLTDSAKASAALSRRCLQNILREKAGVKNSNLSDEIQQALDSNSLPSYIAEDLDAVRNTGNFAAHPTKSTGTGEIVEVEVGEAEWNLDVLEELFDFYFVQPGIAKKKREALNKKLADAGKPPMKEPATATSK